MINIVNLFWIITTIILGSLMSIGLYLSLVKLFKSFEPTEK